MKSQFKGDERTILRKGRGRMDKFKAVDKFRDELMDKFLRLCNYNDFSKLNLEKIADTINEIYDKCIDDMGKEDEGK